MSIPESEEIDLFLVKYVHPNAWAEARTLLTKLLVEARIDELEHLGVEAFMTNPPKGHRIMYHNHDTHEHHTKEGRIAELRGELIKTLEPSDLHLVELNTLKGDLNGSVE